MAIDLLNSFLKREQNITSNSKTSSNASGQKLPPNLQVMRTIRGLQAGQTIQGEIVSVNKDEVQLAILKDVIIEAKLEQSMNLLPGSTMPFQVKANNSQGLSLIPLFTNTATDPHIMKALEMAKLPVNERSMEMVQTLMEKGMSIDKQALGEIYRDVVGFRDASVKDIVVLHQLQLPVTEDNLLQLSLYENRQHYLSDAFYEIGNAISEQIVNWLQEQKTENVKQLLSGLSQLFTETQPRREETAEVVVPEDLQKEQIQTKPLEMFMAGKETMNLAGSLKEEKEPVQTQEAVNRMEAVPHETQDSHKPQKKESIEETKTLFETEPGKGKTKSPDWENLFKEIGHEKNAGRITKFFEKLWNTEVQKNWLMEPEAFMDKKTVKEFYSKLEHQLKELQKVVAEGTEKGSPVVKTVQNTVSNLDFMNQLNHMHTYIQLPLKMAKQNAQGELYVFTNKKSLARQDGKVSALLHLTMEHLGNMDIYVALEDKKVSTNFYLEKEEYLDFIEEHMDILTLRLNKRGYECQAKTSLQNQRKEPLITTIQKQHGQATLLSMQAFDVRA